MGDSIMEKASMLILKNICHTTTRKQVQTDQIPALAKGDVPTSSKKQSPSFGLLRFY